MAQPSPRVFKFEVWAEPCSAAAEYTENGFLLMLWPLRINAVTAGRSTQLPAAVVRAEKSIVCARLGLGQPPAATCAQHPVVKQSPSACFQSAEVSPAA